jgi:hypothetical protein
MTDRPRLAVIGAAPAATVAAVAPGVRVTLSRRGGQCYRRPATGLPDRMSPPCARGGASGSGDD